MVLEKDVKNSIDRKDKKNVKIFRGMNTQKSNLKYIEIEEKSMDRTFIKDKYNNEKLRANRGEESLEHFSLLQVVEDTKIKTYRKLKKYRWQRKMEENFNNHLTNLMIVNKTNIIFPKSHRYV